MNPTLKRLKDINAENCVTIIINSHRTKPDYLNDELALKNHIKEVETRLLVDTTKRDATKLIEKLHRLAGQIDHSRNLDSLMFFVNDDIYDEMMELNMNFGGDVVFLPKGELDKFNGFGAVTRY